MFTLVVLAVLTLAGIAQVAPTRVALLQDPDLQPRFPVKTFRARGSYHGGPVIPTLVGNTGGDPSLEMESSSLNATLYVDDFVFGP